MKIAQSSTTSITNGPSVFEAAHSWIHDDITIEVSKEVEEAMIALGGADLFVQTVFYGIGWKTFLLDFRLGKLSAHLPLSVDFLNKAVTIRALSLPRPARVLFCSESGALTRVDGLPLETLRKRVKSNFPVGSPRMARKELLAKAERKALHDAIRRGQMSYQWDFLGRVTLTHLV